MAHGAVAVSVAVLLGASVAAQDAGEGSKQETTDLVERTGARLVQIEVNLTGPAEALAGVTRNDFRLQIGGQKIADFDVDMLCRDPGQSHSLEVAAGDVALPPPPGTPVPSLGPATFLFYFDQQHLTQGGRQESIDILKAMIPELIRDGNRGTLVSNSAKLETLAELTTDPQVLLSALHELQGNHEHFDPDAQQEQTRIAEVLEGIGIGDGSDFRQSDYQGALLLAQQYYQDELWRAERNLRRFSMVLGSLALVDRPKAVIYFADNMRRNAGQHYLDLFGEFAKRESSDGTRDSSSGATIRDLNHAAGDAQHPFDQVVNQAAAYGVRLYPVEGQGLENPSHQAPTTKQFRDSENTLRDLAAETGGEAFLNGVRTSKIVETLQQDLSCIYLVSFAPEDLPEDVGQKVVVNVDRPKIQVHSQGRIIIQSDSVRQTSRLMAAFACPKSVEGSIIVHPSVVPTGYEDGKFVALVQVTVPHSEVPASTWDLGASVISKGTTREASGRLTVNQAGAPVILQESMTFAPGPFEVVAVAHNTTVDGVGSQQLDGEWPQPNAQLASLGPIAVVQSTKGAIKRGDQTRTSGFVAFAENEPVLADRTVTLVALVCKSSDVKDELLVERQLVGASSVHFKPIEVDLGKDPCIVIHDRIKPGTMTPGAFHYRIQVHDAKDELVSGDRRFFVWDGKTPADVGGSPPSEEGHGV